jgi:hypothetical protein
MKRSFQSLSVVFLLAVVAGCASVSPSPPPACQPVKLPAWVLELSKQPSLMNQLDQLIEPYELESSDSKAR